MDGPKTQFGCHDTRLVLPRTKTDAPLVEKTTQFEGRLGGFETSSGVRWSAIMERAFHDASTHCPGVPTSSAEAAVWVRFEVLNTGRMLLDAIELQTQDTVVVLGFARGAGRHRFRVRGALYRGSKRWAAHRFGNNRQSVQP